MTVHYRNAAEQTHTHTLPAVPTPVSLHKGRGGMIILTADSFSNTCHSFSHSVKSNSAGEVKRSVWKIPSGFYDKRRKKAKHLWLFPQKRKKKKISFNRPNTILFVQYTAVPQEFSIIVSR